jgi:heme oxygenase (biliverdin-IX-beta and delta-forming)
MLDLSAIREPSTHARLRRATGFVHQRLEERLDAVEQFVDPQRRNELIARFAGLHRSAETVLATHLKHVAGLDFEARCRARHFVRVPGQLAPFPAPRSTAEALGMLYVLEGSTLGGHVILRHLAARGVDITELSFLNPYGKESGAQWRRFLNVLERETAESELRTEEACGGAIRAFEHVEAVLCGDTG